MAPWPGTTCPVCGQANACVPAASGRFDLPCWCTDARFDAALLARVRAKGERACICAVCAARAAGDAAAPAEAEATRARPAGAAPARDRERRQ